MGAEISAMMYFNSLNNLELHICVRNQSYASTTIRCRWEGEQYYPPFPQVPHREPVALLEPLTHTNVMYRITYGRQWESKQQRATMLNSCEVFSKFQSAPIQNQRACTQHILCADR